MTDYIKLNNTWVNIAKVYNKINNIWTESENFKQTIGKYLYIYKGALTETLIIIGNSSYTGKTFLLRAKYGNNDVHPTWSITTGGAYASINSNGKVTIASGITNENIVIEAEYEDNIITKTITISYDNELIIEAPETITGTSGNVIARYNSVIISPTWSIT